MAVVDKWACHHFMANSASARLVFQHLIEIGFGHSKERPQMIFPPSCIRICFAFAATQLACCGASIQACWHSRKIRHCFDDMATWAFLRTVFRFREGRNNRGARTRSLTSAFSAPAVDTQTVSWIWSERIQFLGLFAE